MVVAVELCWWLEESSVSRSRDGLELEPATWIRRRGKDGDGVYNATSATRVTRRTQLNTR